MPDTQTLETTVAHERDNHDRPDQQHGMSATRLAAAIEAAYILEAVRK